MTLPPIGLIVAAGGSVLVASYGGPKLASKFVGPELAPGDAAINTAKVYGITLGVGIAAFVALALVLG